MNKAQPPVSILKIHSPCRDQVEMRIDCLDDRLPSDHKARKVWDFVEMMDTDPCYYRIGSLFGAVGRAATDPKVFFALWLFALTEGVISARRIESLCEEHDAYRWIAGCTGVNRTNLSEFRASDASCFHELLTNSLALMVKAGLLAEEDFGQDGTRVQAAAGFNTYRRKPSLEELLASAEEYVKEVEQIDPAAIEKNALAARKRAATERRDSLLEALKELKKYKSDLVESTKKRRKAPPSEEDLEKARVTYRDPQARKMKMGDGGYRLAFNVQFATGTTSRVIYGVDVVNTLDPGTVGPMINQLKTRVEKIGLPAVRNIIGDSAYSGKDDLQEVATLYPEVTVTAPAKTNSSSDPKIPKKGDSEAVLAWRERLGTEEFAELYRQRPSSTEFSNMTTKAHGMRKFLVRGLGKVSSMAILHAITHNMVRFWDLIKEVSIPV